MRKMVLAVFALALPACTNAEHARQTLSAQGYTEIETGGYDWFGCGEGDEVATKFTATAPSGARVEGTVCKGLFFKNATLRFR